MTDYSDLVPAAPIVLERASTGTPYDTLVLDVEESGVSLFIKPVYGSSDGIPFDVWHGRCRRFTLATGGCVIYRNALVTLLTDGGRLSTLIDRIKNGLSVDWDGSNVRGTLTDDAYEAEAELENWIDRCGNGSSLRDEIVDDSRALWDIGDWMAGYPHGITATTSDEELAAWAEEAEATAIEDGVHLIGSVIEWAEETRQQLRDEAAEAADHESMEGTAASATYDNQ